MELCYKLFGSLLAFVYHCFDRIVIQGYPPLLTRPEHIVYFFRDIHGMYPITKQALAKRTEDYQHWVEAYARNHCIPFQWPDEEMKKKDIKKEDYVRPYLLRMERRKLFGPYFIFHGHSCIAGQLQRPGAHFRKDNNAFLRTDNLQARQQAADRLSPEIIRKRLDYWTFVLGPKFSKKDRAAVPLHRDCSLNQVEYCRNFIFRRNFPIHMIFERSCELGLFRAPPTRSRRSLACANTAACLASSRPC
jgi:hypothetical protein